MNFGRMPVGFSVPMIRPSSTPVCSNLKMSCSDDDVALHALDLGDVDDLARAVAHARLVDDQVDGRGDLLADRPHRQVHARPSAPSSPAGRACRAGCWRGAVVSEPSWPVFIAWSMSSASPPRHSPTTIRSGRMRRALITRSRMVTSPLPSMFGGPRLQRDHVLLAQLQLGGVLDGDDALVVRDEDGEHVEQRRLAGAGAAGDDDVQPRDDAGPQELDHLAA